VRFLAIRDRDLLDHYIDTRARLEFERQQLEERQREVAEWLQAEDQRLDQLTRLRRRQSLLLAKLEQEQESLAAQTARLEDKERKLASLLDFLYGRNAERLAGTAIQNFMGVLDWPVVGTVATAFGPRRDPRYKTQTPHNGLELATVAGSEVKAIFPGEVLFASPFQGYGWTAVVHHPGRVFTLYAGLQDLRVARGDVLSLGHVIGRSADSLYFEIRVENRPVDPAEWLR
jgi:septal ring factor EnvC (AmiA/AmiB activator)